MAQHLISLAKTRGFSLVWPKLLGELIDWCQIAVLFLPIEYLFNNYYPVGEITGSKTEEGRKKPFITSRRYTIAYSSPDDCLTSCLIKSPTWKEMVAAISSWVSDEAVSEMVYCQDAVLLSCVLFLLCVELQLFILRMLVCACWHDWVPL